MYKVLFTEEYVCDEAIELLERHNCTLTVNFDKETIYNTDKLAEIVQHYDAIIAGGEVYNKKVLKISNKLKVISRLGSGTESIDLRETSKKGIIVTNTPGENSVSVAELTMGLIISLMRGINYFDRELRKGIWKPSACRELSACTIGILGLGSIGKEVIKRLHGFTSNLLVYDLKYNDNFAEKWNVIKTDFHNLIRSSDILSIHLPLTKSTNGLINEKVISKMKSNSFIVNTSRSNIIEKSALYKALINGGIAGAGIDTHWEEPTKDDFNFIRLENVISTPHIGYKTIEAQKRMVLAAAKNVVSVLLGEMILNEVKNAE